MTTEHAPTTRNRTGTRRILAVIASIAVVPTLVAAAYAANGGSDQSPGLAPPTSVVSDNPGTHDITDTVTDAEQESAETPTTTSASNPPATTVVTTHENEQEAEHGVEDDTDDDSATHDSATHDSGNHESQITGEVEHGSHHADATP
jgi:hypothetical protein